MFQQDSTLHPARMPTSIVPVFPLALSAVPTMDPCFPSRSSVRLLRSQTTPPTSGPNLNTSHPISPWSCTLPLLRLIVLMESRISAVPLRFSHSRATIPRLQIRPYRPSQATSWSTGCLSTSTRDLDCLHPRCH